MSTLQILQWLKKQQGGKARPVYLKKKETGVTHLYKIKITECGVCYLNMTLICLYHLFGISHSLAL
jgi:hypothetical protein